ncbi:MAG: sodium/glutamate symporter [Synechococcaceae cyanobacterium]|nr:sodium/glutamate symporter [Synechococcaceae cyanobacterium]
MSGSEGWLLPLLTGGLEPGGWQLTAVTWLAAAALLTALLLLGSLIGKGLVLHQWGIPEALIAGSLGLLIAPDGALPLLPEAVIRCWDALPLPLLTLVFATLLLGKPLPRPSGLWRPLSAQVLMALTLAFGQYVVAGLAVLLLLRPLLGVSPVMACLIEVSFEGGHGSAAAMGPTYERLGVSGATALGLALSTVGLLASTVVGGLVVVLARRVGWLAVGPGIEPAPPNGDAETPAAQANTPAPLREPPSGGLSAPPLIGGAGHGISLGQRVQRWALNLGLAGLAVAIGLVLLRLLRVAAPRLGGGVAMVVEALPVFPLALVGSLLIRPLVERCGAGQWVSAPIQNRVGSVAADLLIAAATACLDLSLLAHDWLPVLVLSTLGLAWNLAILLLLAPRLLPSPWFSRGIIEFGQATGVAASGLLLLNMADPQDQGDALTPFSIKQLLMQPLVAGGVITVVAPLAVASWGLGAWTALSLVVVLVAGGTGLWLGRGRRPA